MSAQISFVAVIAARLNSLSGRRGVLCEVVNVGVIEVVEDDVDDDVIDGVVKREGEKIVDDVVGSDCGVVVDDGASEGTVVGDAIGNAVVEVGGGAEVVGDSWNAFHLSNCFKHATQSRQMRDYRLFPHSIALFLVSNRLVREISVLPNVQP